MTQTTSLLWKQWHDTRVYLWVGLGLFLGLPVVAGLEYTIQHGRRFEIEAYGFPSALGGVLAVFLAVGITSTDFRSRLEDFWRSRPVSIWRWVGIKYLVGLAALELACIAPIGVELLFSQTHDGDRTIVLTFFPFFWAAIYSLAFLGGCLVRRPSHAVTIGLAAMLLVYLLPIVLPPLGWMNVADFSQFRYAPTHDRTALQQWTDLWTARQIGFAIGMTGLSVAAVVVSVAVVTRGWRIEAGRKMLYGSVSAALLLLFASAAFQLGTNLPVLQQIDLPAGEVCQNFYFDGRHGSVITWMEETNSSDKSARLQHPRMRSLDLTPAGLQLGPAVDAGGYWWGEFDPVGRRLFRISYPVGKPSGDNDPGTEKIELNTIDLQTNASQKQVLWEQSQKTPRVELLLSQGKLYVMGDRLVVLDVTAGGTPKVVSDTPFKMPNRQYGMAYTDPLMIALVPIPGMSPEQQLTAAVRFTWWNQPDFDGRTLCVISDGTVFVYELTSIQKGIATFKKTGECKTTYLQQFFGQPGSFDGRLMTRDGLAFTQNGGRVGVLNSGFSVYDIAGPGPVKQVGHFAAPGAMIVCPLPDGRAIVGGSKLWLVGRPPGYDRQ